MVKNKVHESGNLELEGTPLYTKIISACNRLWSTITGAQQYRFNLMLMNSRRRKLKHISLIYTANPGSTISMSHSVVDSLIIQEMRHWPQSQHFSDPEPYLKIWSHIWRCQDIRKSLSSLYYTRKLKSAHIMMPLSLHSSDIRCRRFPYQRFRCKQWAQWTNERIKMLKDTSLMNAKYCFKILNIFIWNL